MIRGLMTDEEWAIFMPFLTTASSRGGRPPKNHRHRLDGILWICRTGAPWRDLPAAFGKWHSVWKQSRRWCESGVWDLLLQALADSGGALDMLQMIDSTIIRKRIPLRRRQKDRGAKSGTRPFARWVQHQNPCALQRPRGAPHPGVVLSEGEAHDATAYDGLMQQRDSDPGAMLADKGYDSDAIRHDLRDSGATPGRSDQEQTARCTRARSANRSSCAAVTGLSASLAISRSSGAVIATRYDKLATPASWDSSCSDASASGRGLSTGPRHCGQTLVWRCSVVD